MDETIGNIGLSVDKNGKVKQTIGNCVTVINYDDRLKEMFRYNEMTDRIEVLGAWWNQSSVNLSDNDLNNIRLYLETIYGLAHEKTIPRAIDIIAHQRSYHPVRKYLQACVGMEESTLKICCRSIWVRKNRIIQRKP